MPLFVTNQDIETLDFDLFALFDCKYLKNYYEINTFGSKRLSVYLKDLNNEKKINRYLLLNRKIGVVHSNQLNGTNKKVLGETEFENFNKLYLNIEKLYADFYSDIDVDGVEEDEREKRLYAKIVNDPKADFFMEEMEKVADYFIFNSFFFSLPLFQYDRYSNKQFVSPYYSLNEENGFQKPDKKSGLYEIYNDVLKYAENNNLKNIAIPILYSDKNSNQYYISKARRIIRKILNDRNDDYTVYLLLTNTDNNYYIADGSFEEDLTAIIPTLREDIENCYSIDNAEIEDFEEEVDDEEKSDMICCCRGIEEKYVPRRSRLDRLIKDRLKNKVESFSEMVMRKIKEKSIDKVDCYKAANVNKNIFSKITKEIHGDENQDGSPFIYHPDKKIVLAFTIALKLNRSEAEEMMNKAGFAFTNSPLDVIVQIFIDKEIYDIDFVNQYLFKYKQPLLGTTTRD